MPLAAIAAGPQIGSSQRLPLQIRKATVEGAATLQKGVQNTATSPRQCAIFTSIRGWVFERIGLAVTQYSAYSAYYLPYARIPGDTEATTYLHSPRNAIHSAHLVLQENECWKLLAAVLETAQQRIYRVVWALVAAKIRL